MELDSVLLDLLVKVVVTLVLAAIPPLTLILVRIAFLKMQEVSSKTNLGTDTFWILNDFVKTAILAAEQSFESDDDKFAYAIEILISFADSFNIPLSEDQAEALIEGMIKSVKQGVTPTPPGEPVAISGIVEEFEI